MSNVAGSIGAGAVVPRSRFAPPLLLLLLLLLPLAVLCCGGRAGEPSTATAAPPPTPILPAAQHDDPPHAQEGSTGTEVDDGGRVLTLLRVPQTPPPLQRFAMQQNGMARPIVIERLRLQPPPFVQSCRALMPLAAELGGHALNHLAHETKAAIPVALLVLAGQILFKEREDKIVCRYRPR